MSFLPGKTFLLIVLVSTLPFIPLKLGIDSDAIMLIAVLLGPIIAVQVQKYLETERSKQDGRLRLFKILMATRKAQLSVDHVHALNLIDLEFYGADKKSKNVISAWRAYHSHLSDGHLREQSLDFWINKIGELHTELLYRMAICLGLDFDKTQLEKVAYAPEAHSTIENENAALRKGLLALLEGEKRLPIEFPTSEKVTPSVRKYASPSRKQK